MSLEIIWFLYEKRKYLQFSKVRSSNWLGVYTNEGGNPVRQQHQTLKTVTDGKLLILNILGQHLSLHETQNFHRKQTNLAFDLSFGTNVEQGMCNIPNLIS